MLPERKFLLGLCSLTYSFRSYTLNVSNPECCIVWLLMHNNHSGEIQLPIRLEAQLLEGCRWLSADVEIWGVELRLVVDPACSALQPSVVWGLMYAVWNNNSNQVLANVMMWQWRVLRHQHDPEVFEAGKQVKSSWLLLYAKEKLKGIWQKF